MENATVEIPSVQTTWRKVYPWIAWVLGASFFFIHYFARVSTSVLVEPLMKAFNANALMIGSLSFFFYIAYVGMQLPVGILLDRFGVRRLLSLAILICGVGCALFGSATLIGVAELGRFLLGFGAAFAFVGTMKIASAWFPAERFGLLAGATQAAGMLGAFVGEAPMVYLSEHLGWRDAMWVIASLFVILATLVFLIVRDRSKTVHEREEKHLIRDLMTVFANPQTWLNGLFVGLLFAPTAGFGELWGPQYLSQTYHLTLKQAANAVGVIYLGWAIGGPIVGMISDKLRRRKPVMFASAFASLVFTVIVLYVPSNATLLTIALFLFGISNTGVAISYAVAAEINPVAVSGTSIAFANMASVIIGASLQPMIGWVLDRGWHGKILHGIPVYSIHDYRVSMVVLPTCLLFACIVCLWIKETHCEMQAS